MDKLTIDLEHCYGIKKLQATFDFTKRRSVAIYAPNGAMKSSLAETFRDIGSGQQSKDRVFPKRTTVRAVTDEKGAELSPESVVVLSPYEDVFSNSQKMSTLLVDPPLRAEYEKLLHDIEKSKEVFLKALAEVSGSKRLTEEEISRTFTKSPDEFYAALVRVRDEVSDLSDPLFAQIRFDRIFDDKILAFLATKDFKSAIREYITKYDELISASSYFLKGTFNYYNAEQIAKHLAANGFFEAKHTVTLRGQKPTEITSEKELAAIIQSEKEAITNDPALRKSFNDIAKQLEKNAELRSFHQYLLENEVLLAQLPNIEKFKEELLKSYFKAKSEVYFPLVDQYRITAKRKKEIEDAAAKQRTQWEKVIDIFNDRFFVPFTVVPTNKIAVMLRENTAVNVTFSFADGNEQAVLERDALLTTLSTGEKKALYVLYIIFEVESRRQNKQPTLFVVDDIADSFDYKNKYAIIEYLREISEDPWFCQLILTHNFDFFRTVSSRVVGYNDCYMAFKDETGLVIDKAEGINNIFAHDWKLEFFKSSRKKVASIPFIRNMIEYARGTADPEYVKLTSLLHCKPDTGSITVGELDKAFQSIFGGGGISVDSSLPVARVMVDAVADCLAAPQGFNFENKIVLSIAIRLLAEEYMIKRLADAAFVSGLRGDQTGKLFGRFKEKFRSEEQIIKVLQKVILMTPESIHLNSFMYEPILDMSDVHLRRLYAEMEKLPR